MHVARAYAGTCSYGRTLCAHVHQAVQCSLSLLQMWYVKSFSFAKRGPGLTCKAAHYYSAHWQVRLFELILKETQNVSAYVINFEAVHWQGDLGRNIWVLPSSYHKSKPRGTCWASLARLLDTGHQFWLMGHFFQDCPMFCNLNSFEGTSWRVQRLQLIDI